MLNLIFLILTASFLTFLLAGTLLTIFKKQIAFNERVSMYFAEPTRRQKRDSLNNEKQSKFRKELIAYWDKGTHLLNQRVSKSDQKRVDSLLRDAGYPFKSAIDFQLFQIVLCVAFSLPIILLVLPSAD